ncbi:TBC1 domain family member whacked [Frankliniella fusca]|uniref:TBC1 domain family member whacked n=1 Tax=Frankliniella fusca TaxID=407009 RepID=A0AAE1H299_9NEOP|nr:TBC1 domain family member whacked [Frankliniella fusca]
MYSQRCKEFTRPCSSHGEPNNIEELCSDVHSDNPLHSMFRKEPAAGPVRCLFTHPPYTFSYKKGTGECASARVCSSGSRPATTRGTPRPR